MSSSIDAEALAWGTSPRLYLSYGMVALKGMRPALRDAVKAAPSFTVLSPPMGLDFFTVLDGRGFGVAAAGGESERLLALLRDVVAGQVYLELCSDRPRFLAEGTSKLATAPWTTIHASVSSAPPPPAAAGVGDVVAVEQEARDEFLILASAALWDKVTPAAACAHVRRRLGRTSRVTMPWETRITDNVSVGLVVFRDF